jgi:hypothetical protein
LGVAEDAVDERRMRFIGAAVMLGLFGTAMLSLVLVQWWQARTLAAEGVPGNGRVVEKLVGSHGAVHFVFRVGEREYGGVGTAGFGAPSWDALRVGDSVPVAYLPSNPHRAVLGSAAARERSARTGVLVTAGMLAALATASAAMLVYAGRKGATSEPGMVSPSRRHGSQ